MTKKWLTSGVLAGTVLVLAIALLPGSAAGKSKTGLHSFHGTVGAVSKKNNAFRIRQASGARVRFIVSSSTVYERLSGLSALTKGKAIEVKARKINGAWVARKVEPDNDGAGDDNGGDRPRGGSDDPPGDDNGGDRPRGGSDDPPGDDNGGDRPRGGSDDPPGDDHGGDGR